MSGLIHNDEGSSHQKVNILIVDDERANRLALEAVLSILGQNLIEASSGEEALHLVQQHEFAVILLDVQMRGMDGFETAKRIRAGSDHRDTPIIFVTAYDHDYFPIEVAYSLGAVDFLIKPLVPVILRAKVARFVELFQKTEQVKRQAERLRQLERREFSQSLTEGKTRLQDCEARKTAILETALDCIISIDHEGRVIDFNPAAEKTFGYRRVDLLGKPMAEYIVPPALRDAHYRGMAHYFKSGEGPVLGNRIEITAMRSDGTEFPVELAIVPILTEGPPNFTAYVRDITERRIAQEKLKESEQRFVRFMQHLPGLAWLKDLQGRYVYINDAAEKAFRTPRTQLYGKTDKEVFSSTVAAQFQENDLQALSNSAGVQLVETLLQEDGVHHSIVSKFPIPGPDGKPAWIGGIAIDISDRIRAEEQTRFQAHLLNAVEQAVVASDRTGRVTYWNRFAETQFGWSKSEAIGRNIIQLIVAPDSAADAESIMQQLLHGKSWSGEIKLRHRNGTDFPAWVIDTPIFDGSGVLEAVVGVSTNISERKRVEHALRFLADASASLSTLVDYESTLQSVASLAVPSFADWCAIDMVDHEDTLRRLAVAHVDPSKVKLIQDLDRRYPPHPSVTHGTYQVLRNGRSELVNNIHDSLLTEVAQDAEHLRLLRQLGLTSYICVPLKSRDKPLGVLTFAMAESGIHYTDSDLAFAEEIARRAAIAMENSQLYANLREADRLKDEFLAMLAHELRNPLTPIRNALQIMKMPTATMDLIGQSRDMAERQVQHMARLLEDLLDVSRISRGRIELRKEIVDLASIIDRTVEGVRVLIDERGHQLTISLPANSVRVDGDPTRLEQVVTNLLNNAAKYTDTGGRIWLSVEQEDNEAVMRVRDSGIGIAPEMLSRIFDLFVQAERRLDRSQGGVGIGLTLVRKLVELHNGRIEAFSEGLGKGSEFVIRIPAWRGEITDKRLDYRDRVSDPPAPARRVLVVDDNVDAADSLAMLLKMGGHDVRTAYSGPATLLAVRSFNPQVILLDIGMPEMDGYEVARRLRKNAALENMVLVALTGWGQEEDRQRSRDAGFNHHLVKPIEPNLLQKLLRDPQDFG